MIFECHKCKVTCIEGTPEEGPEVAGKRAFDPYNKGWRGTASTRITHVPMVCPNCHKTRGIKKQYS